MAKLDAPERLSAINETLLSEEQDPELQQITGEAAALLGCPICLVSVVLRHIQYFRAHTGLPPDLAVSCATSRSSSFCQFVVEGEEPFQVDDATLDARVPAELVQSHGVRAYLGVPVRYRGAVAGSLCVIDVAPRVFRPEHTEQLRGMADRVERRLEQLEQGAPPPGATDRAQAIAHIAQVAGSMQGALDVVLPLAEAAALLSRQQVTAGALESARSMLADALRFHQKFSHTLDELERTWATLGADDRAPLTPPLDELRLYCSEARSLTRVIEAYLYGKLDGASAARALSVARDTFALSGAASLACQRLIDAGVRS